ncbi:MAG: tRNA (adenosine(37)-N6)-dimethylallyltransferase MiaA [Bdellovibrionota bacterium]
MEQLIIISGSTACGKTKLSLELANKFKTEIISLDSVQIYKEFDLGSAKPSQTELSARTHHLINYASPLDSIDPAAYSALVVEQINRLVNQGRLPILAGGSTLYITSLLHGLDDLPKASPEIRFELEKLENQELYTKLTQLDSERAAELHPNDRFRVIRAIEIKLIESQSDIKFKKHNFSKNNYSAIILILCRQREDLYRRIDARVEGMLAAGLVNEVKLLCSKYEPENLHAINSLGYKQVLDFLKGELSEDQLAEAIAQQTRRYAKRQQTFWRNEPVKRNWLQFPEQGSQTEAILKSDFEPQRKTQVIKDFNVLNLNLNELEVRMRERLEQKPEQVEVWYLNAETIFKSF